MYDEKQVLRRVQEGDRCAFEQLLDQYETRVYRLALRYANSVPDAEDLTQEIFLGIYRVLDSAYGTTPYGSVFSQAGANALVGVLVFQLAETLPGAVDRRRMSGGGMHINRRLD